MKVQEFAAKTVDAAIEQGLEELGVERDRAEIEVLDVGGFLKKAKVRITVKDTPGQIAKDFLENLLKLMDIPAFVNLDETEEESVLNIVGADVSKLFGKRGEVIDALQYLSSLVANNDEDGYRRIVLDSENYRIEREERLQKLADDMAAKALERGFRIKLDPMNPYERRVIHTHLQQNPEVTTHSEGEEPNRYLVIVPANAKQSHYEPRRKSYGDRKPYGDRNRDDKRGGGRGKRDDRRGGGRGRRDDRRGGGRGRRDDRKPAGERPVRAQSTFIGTIVTPAKKNDEE